MGFLRRLGPGFITGAADEDPSNIATYSQVGAQFGYAMLWTTWFLYPLVVAIQEISGRIGRVTGRGLAANLHRYYPPWFAYAMVALLIVANLINIGADLAAMAASLRLLVGGHAILYAVGFGLLSAVLEIVVTYDKYAQVLKWFTVTLLAYVATAFVAHVDWVQAMRNFTLPSVQPNAGFLMGIVAILGTTISPYLFFWQSSQEVEIERETPGEDALLRRPSQAPTELRRIRLDTLAGMGISQIIALFIVVTAAATLGPLGLKEVPDAAQAAQALRPIGGHFAVLLFSLGVIGTGLLAVPALAGSAAYAGAEVLGWREGLSRRPREAIGFYAILGLTTIGGAALDVAHINPMKALYLSAILNGIIAAPMMVLIMRMASRPHIMGRFVLTPALKIGGWLATASMLASVLALIAQAFVS